MSMYLSVASTVHPHVSETRHLNKTPLTLADCPLVDLK